jgi:hypothetical protein
MQKIAPVSIMNIYVVTTEEVEDELKGEKLIKKP